MMLLESVGRETAKKEWDKVKLQARGCTNFDLRRGGAWEGPQAKKQTFKLSATPARDMDRRELCRKDEETETQPQAEALGLVDFAQIWRRRSILGKVGGRRQTGNNQEVIDLLQPLRATQQDPYCRDNHHIPS